MRSTWRSAALTIAVSALSIFGLVFLGASARSRGTATELDCPGGLRVQASFATAKDADGHASAAAAARSVARTAVDEYDAMSTADGAYVVRDGDRTVASVAVTHTPDGFIAEGIEACASDYVSP